MSKQTRWICRGCDREWVAWVNQLDGTSDICPRCKSPQIEQVTYDPQFPGGDIHRMNVSSESKDGPPLPAIEPERVHITENQTLAMMSKDEELALSCPEFE